MERRSKGWVWDTKMASIFILLKDGAKYVGNFIRNKAEGFGKFYHVDGDIYEGNWVADTANGFGKYFHYVFLFYTEWSCL